MFLNHLPEMYKRDDEILKIVEDMEEAYIECSEGLYKLKSMLDPQKTHEGLLKVLCDLTGLNNDDNFLTEKQLRAILPYSFRLNRAFGTRMAIIEAVKRYLLAVCGIELNIWILEYSEMEKIVYIKDSLIKESINEEFSVNPGNFVIAIPKLPRGFDVSYADLYKLVSKYYKRLNNSFGEPYFLYTYLNTIGEGCYLNVNAVLA